MSHHLDTRRRRALDQLRAVMMPLGLVFRSVASFTHTPLGRGWPYHDTSTSIVFELVVFFIHVLRMPPLFLMAGCFAAFPYERRGGRTMLLDRTLRIVVPFVVLLPVLNPTTISGFRFSIAGGVQGGRAEASGHPANPSAWHAGLNTIHLRFLSDLVLSTPSPCRPCRA